MVHLPTCPCLLPPSPPPLPGRLRPGPLTYLPLPRAPPPPSPLAGSGLVQVPCRVTHLDAPCHLGATDTARLFEALHACTYEGGYMGKVRGAAGGGRAGGWRVRQLSSQSVIAVQPTY